MQLITTITIGDNNDGDNNDTTTLKIIGTQKTEHKHLKIIKRERPDERLRSTLIFYKNDRQNLRRNDPG